MAVTEEPRFARRRFDSLVDRLDVLSQRAVFLVVAGPLLLVYLATATWSPPLINDATTNSVAAWVLATEGSVYLEDYEMLEDYYPWYGWFVPAGDSVVSKYPPGTALVAAPAYAIWRQPGNVVTYAPEQIPEEWRIEGQGPLTFPFVPIGPGTLTAALATAAAFGLLAVALVRLGANGSMAVAAAYLGGLGTGAWPVASDQLWQHGPAMAWIALALVLSDTTLFGSGLAYAAAILTRPPLAFIAAGAGLVGSLRKRSVQPALLVGIGASLGLIAFLAYNWWIFGEPSISAGYGGSFQDRFASGSGLGLYLRTLIDAAFSREVGVFIWSPFLLVLLPGLRAGWKASPGWARGAALGGLVYLLVQFKANRATGGSFIGYRYPLEALMAAGPVLFMAYKERIAGWPALRRAFGFAAGVAILIHGLASVGIGAI